MCVCFLQANLHATIVYGRASVRDGRPIHVLGYQNLANNQAEGANAMILPIPARRGAPLSPDNAIDMRAHTKLLDSYRIALRHVFPIPRGIPSGRGPVSGGMVQVFESGSYTVVLAQDAAVDQIEAALAQVPASKRPALNLAVLDAYTRWYPGWHIALCCFDGAVTKAEPMVWWYEPIDPERVFLPGLDGHDGGVPDLARELQIDHTVLLGIDEAIVADGEPSEHGGVAPDSVRWTSVAIPGDLSDRLRPLFPARVCGRPDMHDRLQNGDWYLPTRPDPDSLTRAIANRLPPPGA